MTPIVPILTPIVPILTPIVSIVLTPIVLSSLTGSEKPIENINVGEDVLAWNEETKEGSPSKVVSALHHEAQAETLFDIELENGRKFTVNNNHPMYAGQKR
jgi:hypothetical protein